jgi:4-amino-4-deoxy-L-arabinose transferase-like glycosyltransferase
MAPEHKKKVSFVFLLKILLVLALPVLPCFHHLGVLPLRIWDEARQAHNAYEMYYSGNYWVPTFNGLPDYFGTKPAVFIWMEVLSMKVLGVNEFALRFPAALCAYLLGIGLMIFVWRYFRNYSSALIAGLLLFTSMAMIRIHVARTADYDAPVSAFGSIACLCFFVFLHGGRKLFWYLTCAFFVFAVWMKGTAGILLMPPLLIYTLTQKKFMPLFRSVHTYYGIGIFLFFTMGYYAVRNQYQPGYSSLVFDAEIRSAYFKPVHGHAENFWFYLNNFRSQWFSHYWWLLPAGALCIPLIKNHTVKKAGFFSLIMALGYFFIISSSATKLYWYDAPLYAFVVIVCVCPFYLLFEKSLRSASKPWKQTLFEILIVLSLASLGYPFIAPSIFNPKEDPGEKYFYTMATYLQQCNRDGTDLSGYKILSGSTYAPHHTFYTRQMQAKGQRVNAVVFDSVTVRDSVMVYETNMQELLLQRYHATLLRHEYNIFAYRLDSLNSNENTK